MAESVLDFDLKDVEGIGPKTKEKLLRKFPSVENVKMADRNELEELIGKSKAEVLLKYLKKGSGNLQ